jgi:hypothetical protein
MNFCSTYDYIIFSTDVGSLFAKVSLLFLWLHQAHGDAPLHLGMFLMSTHVVADYLTMHIFDLLHKTDVQAASYCEIHHIVYILVLS